MTFLQLLSQEVYQNFTYTCMNSVAWYNSNNPTNGYDLSLRLLGDNDDEFSYNGFKMQVVLDGCKNRSGKTETVFLVRTKKPQQLPLVDFYPVDYGLPHQMFGFLVGPACFK